MHSCREEDIVIVETIKKRCAQFMQPEDCTPGGFWRTSKVQFINFNYDRVLEHFLTNHYTSFLNDKQTGTAATFIQKMNERILHPYGSIGDIDKVGFSDKNFADSNGRCHSNNNLLEAAANIRTIHENASVGREVSQRIFNMINWAERIIFLGLGFDKQNMRMLFNKMNLRGKEIIGTAYKLENEEKEKVENTIAKQYAKYRSIIYGLCH